MDITRPFIVMSPRGTRGLGVAGLVLAALIVAWGLATGSVPFVLLATVFAVPFLLVGLLYVVRGRYPVIVLDEDGLTYRPFEDAVTLFRRGAVVRLGWHEISSIGDERSLTVRWLTIRSNRTPPRPRWMQALGAGEQRPYIRISPTVSVSEEKLVEEMKARALPHTFTDERSDKRLGP